MAYKEILQHMYNRSMCLLAYSLLKKLVFFYNFFIIYNSILII